MLNVISGLESQEELVERTQLPLFQDVEAIGAWDLHGASKDDLMVYGPDGTLLDWLAASERETHPTDLSTEEGWANVKAAVVGAL